MLYTLITGASSGIGEEFARRYAAKKHNLILVARSEGKLNKLAKELKETYDVEIKVIALDLSHNNSAEKLFKECEKRHLEVNFLINDAGTGLIGKFDEFPLDRIEDMIRLNILTLTSLTYLFLPSLKRHHGTLINLASQIAFAPAPYMAVYAATKAFVLHFTEALRVENEKHVKILSLCPGPTVTDFFSKTDATTKDINFKFRDTKDVVDEAISALKHNKSITVVGVENKMMTFFLHFFSKRSAAKFSSMMVSKRKKKHSRKAA